MTKNISFEKSMEALDNLVSTMEAGDLSLEDALKHYEKGIKLARQCQTLLQKAEQKIETLSQSEEPDNSKPPHD